MRSRRWMFLVLPILGLRLGGCGGASSCGGDPLPGGLPQEEERLGAAQIRITDTGLRWLQDNAGTLLDQLVPGGLSFNISESSQLGGLVVICPAGSNPNGCPFTAALSSVVLIRSPPDVLTATLLVNIDPQSIPVRAFGTDCQVNVQANRTPIQVLFHFSIDRITRALQVTAEIGVVSGERLEIGGTGLCATVTLFRDFLIEQMKTELQTNLTETLEDQLCIPCAAGCPGAIACGARNLCRHSDGQCVAQRTGLAGQIDLAGLLGSVARVRPMPLRYGLTLGGAATVDVDGMTLAMMGGAGAPSPAACVTAAPVPTRTPVDPPTFPATAPDGSPYHVAVALSRELVADALSAVWRAGTFCLLATSEVVPQLTSSAFALVLPALSRLTEGKSRPVLLGVQLEQEPRVAVGLGTSHVDGSGQRVLDEPLLSLELPGLLLDIHTLVEDRMVRIGRVRQDVTLPLGLDFTADGKLELLLGDVAGAVANAEVLDAELLGGTAESLRSAVPALIALALPFVLESVAPFEIPALQGFRIVPRGVRGEGPAGALSHAVVYADLAVAAAPAPMRGVARTAARLAEVAPGRLRLQLGGTSPGGGSLEWSWRLDRGLWSPYTPASRVLLHDPRLRLLGPHQLRIRSRVQGRPETTDPEPVILTFRIEAAPPPPEPAQGCQPGAGPGAGLGAVLLAGILLGLLRRRRT